MGTKIGPPRTSLSRPANEELAGSQQVKDVNRVDQEQLQLAEEALKASQYTEALKIAADLIKQSPKMSGAYLVQAAAFMYLQKFAAATKSCRVAEEIANAKSTGITKAGTLLDQVAFQALKEGSLAGFDGRHLEVRSAGDEAWLGGPAPAIPHLDAPSEPAEGQLMLPAAASSNEFGRELATGTGNALAKRLQYSFRSIKDALEAAKDGDHILLLRGIHNGMGEALNIDKRVYIRGEGLLGETKIDQRANAPTFRIRRTCLIENLDLDMTGFRECVCVAGSQRVEAYLKDCLLKCSGSDAVNLTGSSTALLMSCELEARKTGVKAFDKASGQMVDCQIKGCKELGIVVQDSAKIHCKRCVLSSCEEGGCAVSNFASLAMEGCSIHKCEGPALDLSQQAEGMLHKCSLINNVGGVWAWDNSRVTIREATIDGGTSFPLLSEGVHSTKIQGSTFRGKVDVERAVWKEVVQAGNVVAGYVDAEPQPA